MPSSNKFAALALAVASLSSCHGVLSAGATPSSTNSDPAATSNSGQSNPTNTTRPSDVKGG